MVRSLALFLWIVPALAVADGIDFVDGLPSGHALTWLELTAAQRAKAAPALTGEAFVELELTSGQQAVLARATGVRSTWVAAATAEALGRDCTCGALNLAVLQPGRVGVLHGFLTSALTFERGRRAAESLRDPALAASRRGDARYAADFARFEAGAGDAPWLAALHARAPAAPLRRFADRVPLPAGWRAVKIRLATSGLIGPGELLADDVLKTLPWSESDLRLEPVDATGARWAELGAIRREGATAQVLVPVVADQESDGYRRAWLILVYDGGLLRTLTLHSDGAEVPSVLSLKWADGAAVLEAACWGLPPG